MKRRDFIKTTAAGSAGTIFINSFLGCTNANTLELSLDEHFRNFQNPPDHARLFVRWWWNGNRLDAKEIVRELDVMQAAGITGIEINPIALPKHSDPSGTEALVLFEEQWLDMFELALKEAKKRKMVCDMIVGSGWPFGGEFLKKEEQTQAMALETMDLEGGRSHSLDVQEILDRIEPEVYVPYEGKTKELFLLRLAHKDMQEFQEGEDLSTQISSGRIRLDLPEGEHVLYCVARLYGYVGVTNGAPGAKGPVLNHYDKAAVRRYLDRTSGHINGRMGSMGDYLRAVFCDSLELEGANWCEDMPEQFESRRGYSILPYYPFLLKKIGHFGNPLEEEYGSSFSDEVQELLSRVNLDYYHTRLELFRERFIETFIEWCHYNGVKSRMQAYGRGYHPLESSMLVDLPEGESWMFKEVGGDYTTDIKFGRSPRQCNKAVVSGALLSGKSLVSCEDHTTIMTTFMNTLEGIKLAGDQSNMSGINHSILHGYNYSPPEVLFPGWVRYGTYFSERNPWWPYFKLWGDYRARISYLLQEAAPQADIAVFQPYTDLWMKHGAQFIPWIQKFHPEYQYYLWEAIHQNGGGGDYVTENILKGASFDHGRMNYGERSYRTLLMPEVETLDVETIEALRAFVRSGGQIVFIGNRPFKSPDPGGMGTKDKQVKSLMGELKAEGRGRVDDYPSPGEDIIAWYAEMQETLGLASYVKFHKTSKYLHQNTYELDGKPLYFLANYSLSESIQVEAEFRAKSGQRPWLWNADSGERFLMESDGPVLKFSLPRATSMLIVFENRTEGEIFVPLQLSPDTFTVQGAWQLELKHINGQSTGMELPALTDLSKLPETKGFAGQAVYQSSFTLEKDDYTCLDLGDVQGVAELSLNGKDLGVRWYGAYVFDVREVLKKGENRLTVKLTTICGNYLKTQSDHAVAQRWTARQNFRPMGLLGTVRLG